MARLGAGSLRFVLVTAAAAACLQSACGDGSPAGSGGDSGTDARDAAVDIPVRDFPFDRFTRDWAGVCDPTDQNCAPGQECIINCPAASEFICVPERGGAGAPGDPCDNESCAPGLTCVDSAAGPMCRKWCRFDTDCPAGKECTQIGVRCATSGPAAAVMGQLCAL